MSHDLLFAIGRATLFVSVSIGVVLLFAARAKTVSPRWLRLAWVAAVAQSWLLFPWTLQIETESKVSRLEPLRMERFSDSQSEHLDTSLTTNVAMTQLPTDSAATWRTITMCFVAAWLIGGTLMVLTRLWRYARFVRRLPLVTDADAGDHIVEWQAEWRQVVSTTRLRQNADLRISRDLGPLVCYVPFRYLLLAPRALWERLTKPERTAILRHELAHLRRRDLWKSLAIRLLALPQWFNPLVWLAVRRFDEAAEWACDDEVARTDETARLQLANSLVRAAEFVTTSIPAAASAQGGVLSRRIRRLVTPTVMEDGKMKMFGILFVLAALTAVQSIRIEEVAAQVVPPGIAMPVPAPPPDLVRSASFESYRYASTSSSRKQAAASRLLLDDPTRHVLPAIVALDERGEKIPLQLVAAENGATVGNALSQVKRWFKPNALAQASLWLHRAHEELLITWDPKAGEPTTESNYVLKPGDLIVIGEHRSDSSAGPATPVSADGKVPSTSAAGQKANRPLEKPYVRVKFGDLREDHGGKTIATIEALENTTVAAALAQLLSGPLPAPMISFAKAEIVAHQRNGDGEETTRPVHWDANNRRPTDETNHALQQGDTIVIRDETRPTPDAFVPEAALERVTAKGQTQFHYQILVVRDTSGSMSEFKSNKRYQPGFIGETDTIDATLRILLNNKLVEAISKPRIIAATGETAKILLGTQHPPIAGQPPRRDGFELEVACHEVEQGLQMVTTSRLFFGTDTRVLSCVNGLTKGQSVILATNDDPKPSDATKQVGQDANPIYFVITPTVVNP